MVSYSGLPSYLKYSKLCPWGFLRGVQLYIEVSFIFIYKMHIYRNINKKASPEDRRPSRKEEKEKKRKGWGVPSQETTSSFNAQPILRRKAANRSTVLVVKGLCGCSLPESTPPCTTPDICHLVDMPLPGSHTLLFRNRMKLLFRDIRPYLRKASLWVAPQTLVTSERQGTKYSNNTPELSQ